MLYVTKTQYEPQELADSSSASAMQQRDKLATQHYQGIQKVRLNKPNNTTTYISITNK